MITRLAVWVLDDLLPQTAFARSLEVFMSLTSDALTELDDATNAVADRLDAVLAQNSDMDAATADAIRTESVKLRGLAADPSNPVPSDGDDSADPTSV